MVENYKVIKIIILYYVFMLCFSEKRFTNSVQNNLLNDKFIKHLLTIFNFALVLRYTFNITDIDKLIIKASIIHVTLLCLLKSEIELTVVTLGIVIIFFIVDTKIEHKNAMRTNMSEEEILIIQKKNNFIREIVIFVLLVCVIAGCGLYSKKKYVQYGGSFDIRTFFLK